MEKSTLILLPFAGGSAYSYKPLEPHLSKYINLLPVELPGRGKRVSEKLLYHIDQLTNDVLQSIGDLVRSGQPYSLFGHSMGAILSYLAALQLRKQGLPLPQQLFVSGRPGPQAFKTATSETLQRLHLPPHAFIKEVVEMGGTPQDITQNSTLVNFFEPILRADFTAVSTFVYPGPAYFNIPITIFKGKDESFGTADALLWQAETTKAVTLHNFSGGHFFLFHHLETIAGFIAKSMEGL